MRFPLLTAREYPAMPSHTVPLLNCSVPHSLCHTHTHVSGSDARRFQITEQVIAIMMSKPIN
jgi:hypothetical protein